MCTNSRGVDAWKPLIGLTGRRLPGSALVGLEDRYQVHDLDMFFSAFARSVAAAGGVPVEIPYAARAQDVISRLDGLILTGGQDVAPSTWGGDPACAVGDIDVVRDTHELELARLALDMRVPLLGVCRGAQVLNVALGGTLVPDLPADDINHQSVGCATHERTHGVQTADGSLARLLYGRVFHVNSLHHQAVDLPGVGVNVTGQAGDGTVEIIEVEGSPALGVQWHPEWHGTEDPAFRWLVNVALDCYFGCFPAEREDVRR